MMLLICCFTNTAKLFLCQYILLINNQTFPNLYNILLCKVQKSGTPTPPSIPLNNEAAEPVEPTKHPVIIPAAQPLMISNSLTYFSRSSVNLLNHLLHICVQTAPDTADNTPPAQPHRNVLTSNEPSFLILTQPNANTMTTLTACRYSGFINMLSD